MAATSEMIDRIARIISAGGDARAILRELRTPSPEMVAAATSLPRSATPQEVWEAMIDAA